MRSGERSPRACTPCGRCEKNGRRISPPASLGLGTPAPAGRWISRQRPARARWVGVAMPEIRLTPSKREGRRVRVDRGVKGPNDLHFSGRRRRPWRAATLNRNSGSCGWSSRYCCLSRTGRLIKIKIKITREVRHGVIREKPRQQGEHHKHRQFNVLEKARWKEATGHGPGHE